jgi:hypothetical protein
MDGTFPRLIYLLLVLALVLPGAWHLARRGGVPMLPALLAWGGLLAALMLGYTWWQDRQADVTGPAVIESPGGGRGTTRL